jgi:hypothetical protein
MLSQLEAIVSKPGAKIVGMTTRTMPKLLKKNRKTGEPCLHKAVYRISERVVILACQYESCVNRQRTREDETPDFQAEQLWNGKGRHVPGHPFLVEHTETGKRYVAVMHLSVGQDLWCDEDGNAIDPATLVDFLPLPSDNKRQGTEKPVYWRTVELSNVVSVRYAGEHFSETPLATAAMGA